MHSPPQPSPCGETGLQTPAGHQQSGGPLQPAAPQGEEPEQGAPPGSPPLMAGHVSWAKRPHSPRAAVELHKALPPWA